MVKGSGRCRVRLPIRYLVRVQITKGVVTNYREGGGATKREGGGGASEVLPLQVKEGGSCSHTEGGAEKFWVSFPRKLEVLAILKGEAQKVSTL